MLSKLRLVLLISALSRPATMVKEIIHSARLLMAPTSPLLDQECIPLSMKQRKWPALSSVTSDGKIKATLTSAWLALEIPKGMMTYTVHKKLEVLKTNGTRKLESRQKIFHDSRAADQNQSWKRSCTSRSCLQIY